AAFWDDKISGVILQNPPASHMDPDAPQFLNILRVCDIPDILGMIAPRPLTVYGGAEDLLKKITAIYDAAGARDQFHPYITCDISSPLSPAVGGVGVTGSIVVLLENDFRFCDLG
ncbi:MAG: hypothetical protein GX455_02085, partial [Phycisphaerae bacterium]|nr:hypothetical protein [Phycisphaerae bacterium]